MFGGRGSRDDRIAESGFDTVLGTA
jgi:hypothetical protein